MRIRYLIVLVAFVVGPAFSAPSEQDKPLLEELIRVLNAESNGNHFVQADERGTASTSKDSPLILTSFWSEGPLHANEQALLTLEMGIITLRQPEKTMHPISPRRLAVSFLPSERLVHERFPQADILDIPDLYRAIHALQSGAVDGVVTHLHAYTLIRNDPSSAALYFTPDPSLEVTYGLRMVNYSPLRMPVLQLAIAGNPPALYQALIEKHLILDSLTAESMRNPGIWHTLSGLLLLGIIIVCVILLQLWLSKRKTESQLKDAIVFRDTLIQILPIPLAVCTPDGRVSRTNQAFLEAIGRSEHEVYARHISFLNRENALEPPLTSAVLIGALQNSGPTIKEGRIFSGNGRFILLWCQAFRDTRQIPRGIVIGWTDITHLKLLEEQLAQALEHARRASEEKGSFLARMSHEIRSPLNIIMGALEMEMSATPQPASDMLIMASHAATHLMEMIGQVLDISKIEAGKMRLEARPVLLFECLNETLSHYAFMADRKGLSLRYQITALANKTYLTDKTKILEIINNLLSNAVKYTATGMITVEAQARYSESDNETVILTVSDTGQGIPEEILPDLLNPYTQYATPVENSSGLGLYIVQQLITLMNGRLDIASTPGQGSTFTVQLPLRLGSQIHQVLPAPSPLPEHETLSVLVVDDSPSGLTLVAMQLRAAGYHVVIASNGEEALKKLSENPEILYILTDCNMPVMNGYDLAKCLRAEEHLDLPPRFILGMTANAFSDEERICLQAGMDGVLIKPFKTETLHNAIEGMIQDLTPDMNEIDRLTAGSPLNRRNFLQQLLESSVSDLARITPDALQCPQAVGDVIHRLKGSYAFAGFQRGEKLCEEIEWILAQDNAGTDVALLKLRRAAYHFQHYILRELKQTELK